MSSTDNVVLAVTKFCSKCNTIKHIDEFNRDSRLKDGHKYYCRGCEAISNRNRRENRLSVGLCHMCRNRPIMEGKRTCSACLETRSREKRKAYERDFRQTMLENARKRAKEYGLPFNLSKADIVVPYKCPVLGLVLEIGVGQPKDNSPSLDRIIPDLGYVKGNVAVISFKANRIKNNASLEDLKSLVKWMENYNAY